MAKKENRPSWFKMFGHQKPLVDSIPDEAVGKAIKALFQYFDTGEIVELPPLENALFSSLKPYVDESFEDFVQTSEKNRKKAQQRWSSQKDAEDAAGIN